MKGKWDATRREALKQRSAQRDGGKQEGPRGRQHEPDADVDGPILIWGVHAVEAALRNPSRPIIRMVATDNAALRLAPAIEARGVTPEHATPRDLDQLLGPDTVHQGMLLEVGPLPEHELAKLAETVLARGPLVMLDQVTDPHNVGAIMRSAAVFGSAGLIMTRRNSPPLGGVLAKAASGALDIVPVALVGNLARAIAELKDVGVLCIGLDGAAPLLLEDAALDPRLAKRPLALVLGAEGKGLRQLTAESCDQLCRIASDGPIDSLNVSNAAAVALHVAAMARRRAAG